MSFENAKMLPASLDAEQGVVGSMIIAPNLVIPEMVAKLHGRMFHFPSTRYIFRCLRSMFEASIPIDLISLTERVKADGKLKDIGGPSYVAHLFTITPTAANVGYYSELVVEKWQLREIIQVGMEMASRAWGEGDGGTVDEIVNFAEDRIMKLRKIKRAGFSMPQAVIAAVERIEEMHERKGQIRGLPTGFPSLDKMTDGMLPEDLWIIGARPSVGKTTLVWNIVENVLMWILQAKRRAMFFSLEDSKEQMVLRALYSRAELDGYQLRDTGVIPQSKFPRIAQAARELSELGLHIEDDCGITVEELEARARRLMLEDDYALIAIDYLQLLGTTMRTMNRYEAVTIVSQKLKGMAKRLKVPVLVTAQTSRKKDRPTMDDLKDSGQIEQDANVILLPFRLDKSDEDDAEARRFNAELILAKNKNGPAGPDVVIPCEYIKEYYRFRQITPQRTYEGTAAKKKARS